MKDLILYYPLKNPWKSQGFYENLNPWYREHGMAAHGALDLVTSYGDPIVASQDGLIYKVLNKTSADSSKYKAVCQIVHGKEYSYEIVYGHLKEILVSDGDVVEAGDVIGREGNSGVVYGNGSTVTKKEIEEGSKMGTHLHFQVRLCERVRTVTAGETFLSDPRGGEYKDSEGYYYWVPGYKNGYLGCIDPALYLEKNYAGELSLLRKLITALKQAILFYKK